MTAVDETAEGTVHDVNRAYVRGWEGGWEAHERRAAREVETARRETAEAAYKRALDTTERFYHPGGLPVSRDRQERRGNVIALLILVGLLWWFIYGRDHFGAEEEEPKP